MKSYLNAIVALLGRIETEEASKMAEAAEAVADVICRDGLIYTFGCGHSHLPTLDTFNAVLATRLSEGETLHDACVAANAAAAQSVAIRYVLPSLPRRG